MLWVYIIGIVVAYFVLKYWRSDHPVFFALVWPAALLVVGGMKLMQMQGEKVKPVETSAAPPPLPKLGGIGSDDDDEDR